MVSSPYYRCLQTVDQFVQLRARQPDPALGPLTIRGETGIGEWYGSAPFEHPTPAPPERLRELFANLDDYAPAVVPPRKGESIGELHDRVAAAAQAIIDQCDRDGARAVLLCTHAAVMIALGRVLTGEMPEDVRIGDFGAFTCGLSVYRRRRSDSEPAKRPGEAGAQRREERPKWARGTGLRGGWDCEVNCDCTFLRGGEERGWFVLLFRLSSWN